MRNKELRKELNKIDKKFKKREHNLWLNKLKGIKHIIISLLILLSGVLVFIILPVTYFNNGTSATIFLSTLAVAFSYYQYVQNKIDTKVHTNLKLKLNAYNHIMSKCDDITQDCYSVCFEYVVSGANGIDPNIIRTRMIIDQKIKSLNQIVDYYNCILKLNITSKSYNEFIKYIQMIATNIDDDMFNNDKLFQDLVDYKVDLDCSLITIFTEGYD